MPFFARPRARSFSRWTPSPPSRPLQCIAGLAACFLAGNGAGAAQAAGLSFSGHVPPAAHRDFFAVNDMAIHFGPEAGFRLHVRNPGREDVQVALTVSPDPAPREIRLIGFPSRIAAGASGSFLLVVSGALPAREGRYKVCLSRQPAGNFPVRTDCLQLRSIPADRAGSKRGPFAKSAARRGP